MGKKNYVSKLNEYAKRTQSEVKYEDFSPEGPDGTGRLFQRAVVAGEGFPTGVGRNRKEARQNAAKNALRSLNNKENQGPLEGNPTGQVHPKCGTKLNFASNDYDQQKRVPLQPVGSTRLRLNNAAPFGDKEHSATSGKTKREAKEGAAKLVYQEEPFWSAVPDDGAPTKMSISPNTLDSTDAELKSLPSSTSDSVVFADSSEDQDVMISEEKNTRNSSSDGTSTQSQIIREAEKEVEVLSDLHHDNIIRYYTCWVEYSEEQWDSKDDSSSNSQSTDNSSEKYLYIQMELCDKTLRVWIDERNIQKVRGSTRREDGLTVALQIVSGVEFIHSRKKIHRDLKPANIMFGQDKKVKIGDFGLVTDENDDDAENPIDRTVYRGTPSYMAPEQKSQKTYNRKVDIFPLGLIMFKLLWRIGTVHERDAVWGDLRRQKLPQGFLCSFLEECTLIKSMLCENPEGRPEASKVKADLEAITRRLNKNEIMRRGSRTV